MPRASDVAEVDLEGASEEQIWDACRQLGLDVFGQQNPRRQIEAHEWAGR